MTKITTLLGDNSRQIETPCYLYSVSKVAENYQKLKNALGTELIYSMKANNNIDLLMRAAHLLTGGIEVASIGELNLVAGGNSAKYINNPSADKKFLRAAVASKATVIVDNLEQLSMLKEFVGKRPVKPILLRLNSCVLKQFNEATAKIRADHFGMDWDTACEAIELCKTLDIQLAGFHLFNGSYSFTRHAVDTAQAAIDIIAEMESRYGQQLSFVNLGGGFAEHDIDSDFDFAAYREQLQQFPSHITLAHETGRGLMASTGYFATRVRYVKNIEHQRFAVCDGGMNQNFLLARTENRLSKPRTPELIADLDNREKGSCSFVGSSCSKDDVIGKQDDNCYLPQPGDICLFDNCGAYNASYTVTPFLKLPEAKFYIIE